MTLNASGLAKVRQWVDSPAQNFGLIMASASNTNGLDFAAREAATVADRPRPTITYAAPEVPDAGGRSPGAGRRNRVGRHRRSGWRGWYRGRSGCGRWERGRLVRWRRRWLGGNRRRGTGVDSGAAGGTAGKDASAADASADSALRTAPGPPERPVSRATGARRGAQGRGGGGSGGGGTGGAPGPVVVYAAGDIGHCSSTGDTATGNLLDSSLDPIRPGDNVYEDGTLAGVHQLLQPDLGAPQGAHESGPRQPRVRDGQRRRDTSATSVPRPAPGQGYYSYDFGAWHIIVLNSNCDKVSPAPAAFNPGAVAPGRPGRERRPVHPCPVAPPPVQLGRQPRQQLGPLGPSLDGAPPGPAPTSSSPGHEHVYERFAPQYPSGQADPRLRLAEITVGTGGASRTSFTTTMPANTAKRSSASNGILKLLTLRDGGYDWQYLKAAGSTSTFTDTGSANCH